MTGGRELVLSYFEFYYNLDGEKTLRSGMTGTIEAGLYRPKRRGG